MLRKRYYILFVARDEDGRVRKIPVPLQYAYGFVAAALVGAFTIVGLAGSYTRMLLKTESFNQVRQDRENLRKDYKQMAQIAHDRGADRRQPQQQARRNMPTDRVARRGVETSPRASLDQHNASFALT